MHTYFRDGHISDLDVKVRAFVDNDAALAGLGDVEHGHLLFALGHVGVGIFQDNTLLGDWTVDDVGRAGRTGEGEVEAGGRETGGRRSEVRDQRPDGDEERSASRAGVPSPLYQQ